MIFSDPDIGQGLSDPFKVGVPGFHRDFAAFFARQIEVPQRRRRSPKG
jgi:hypothetical protein